jgi:twitching motility protein PilJ
MSILQMTMPNLFKWFQSKPAKPAQATPSAEVTRAREAAAPAAVLKERKPGLRLIGHLPVARQLQILLGLLGVSLALAALSAYLHNQHTAHHSVYLSTATEMQTLSQRIANSAQQATQGVPVAFDQLQQGRKQFNANLTLLATGGEKRGTLVPPSAESIQPALGELRKLWRPVEANVDLIFKQKPNLIELKELETLIDRSVPRLSMLTLELVTLTVDAGEPARVVAFTRLLHADVVNFNFVNALRTLSTERPNPQVALQLVRDSQNFQKTLDALLGNAKDAAVAPISNERAKRKAAELHKVYTPFAAAMTAIVANMRELAQAKQGSRDIFAAHENLLTIPTQLIAAYQGEARTGIYYLSAAVAATLLALACLVLLGKLFLDDARRRAQESEQFNTRTQEAILRLLDEMGRVAGGDLTTEAMVTEDITGAIADSVNYTIEELRRLVSGITKAADEVGSATDEAQKITSQLLQATQKQWTEIQVTGQSVIRMTESINQVSGNAFKSADVAQQSLSAAEKGRQAVQNAIRGMNDIREQIQETSKRIKRLGESSQEIGEIVQLITDITEQTNVLALNAAIQAASAGEAGRGFAVVAEEVQRLAERSGEATKHISAIIKSIQRDTLDAVEAMERSTQGVVEETRVADEAGQALQEIENVSRKLDTLIASISTATQEQAKAAAQVVSNMKDIRTITQLTTDGTRKTASSAAQLNALANELKSSVSGFKLA